MMPRDERPGQKKQEVKKKGNKALLHSQWKLIVNQFLADQEGRIHGSSGISLSGVHPTLSGRNQVSISAVKHSTRGLTVDQYRD
jgi:hypothetical protein